MPENLMYMASYIMAARYEDTFTDETPETEEPMNVPMEVDDDDAPGNAGTPEIIMHPPSTFPLSFPHIVTQQRHSLKFQFSFTHSCIQIFPFFPYFNLKHMLTLTRARVGENVTASTTRPH